MGLSPSTPQVYPFTLLVMCVSRTHNTKITPTCPPNWEACATALLRSLGEAPGGVGKLGCWGELGSPGVLGPISSVSHLSCLSS